MLNVRLAGGLALERDGVALELPRSRRGRALLAWLALHPGDHARGSVAALFWPDVLDESARQSLRAALTELRNALGEDAACLVATRSTVGLDGATVDVREFSRLVDAGEVEAAVAACSGELLTGMDDEWVLDARADHARRAGVALEQLALAAADPRQAIAHTRAAAALDPLGEEVHRRLIERLAAAGDRSGALAVYEQLATRLRANLGISPAAATRALASQLRTDSTDVPAIPLPRAVARIDDVPFVGREPEVARISAICDEARAKGDRTLVLISGEPGVGKTRLALRLAEREHRAGSAVLFGRCEDGPGSAYAPFAEMLWQVQRAVGGDGVAQLAGPAHRDLARLEGFSPADAQADAAARLRLFDAVDAMLSALAERLLVLVVDDLQWADRASALLLGSILGSDRRGAIVVIATARTGPTRIADMSRTAEVHRMALRNLERDEVSELAHSWLGDDADDELAEEVHARSGGNALLAQELLRHGGKVVPDSIRETVGARREGLSRDADELLDLAAVVGVRSELRLLYETAGLQVDAGDVSVDELVAAHLLRPGALGEVEFPHALLRDVIYEEIGAVRRQRLHARLAAAIDPSSPEEKAHHLLQGGDPAAAVPYLETAADRSMAVGAFETAARLRADAVVALDSARDDDHARRGRLLCGAGEALLHAGDPAGATVRFAQAADIARRIADPALLARAALGRCGLGVEIVNVDPERVVPLEEALGALGDAGDAELVSALKARLSVELYYASPRERSERLSAEAVEAAREAGSPRAVALALNARHVALWRPDRLEERRAAAEQMLRSAQAAGDHALAMQARNWLVVDTFEAGDLDEWRKAVAQYAEHARALRLPAFSWYAELWAAVDALHSGRLEEAAELREAAYAAGSRAGDRNADVFNMMLEIEEQMIREDFSATNPDDVWERVHDTEVSAAYRSGFSWVLAWHGRADEAREHLTYVSANGFANLPFDTNWLSAVGESAECALLLGDRDAARQVLDVLEPFAGRQLAAGRAVVTHGAADRQLGNAARVLGRREEAIAHYREAVRIDAAAGLLPWAERAQRALDEISLQRAVPAGAQVRPEPDPFDLVADPGVDRPPDAGSSPLVQRLRELAVRLELPCVELELIARDAFGVGAEEESQQSRVAQRGGVVSGSLPPCL